MLSWPACSVRIHALLVHDLVSAIVCAKVAIPPVVFPEHSRYMWNVSDHAAVQLSYA
jgi:hypothetical protein